MKNPFLDLQPQRAPSIGNNSASTKGIGYRIWQYLMATATCSIGAYVGILAFLGVTRPEAFSSIDGRTIVKAVVLFLWDTAGVSALCIVPGLVAGSIGSYVFHLPNWSVFCFRVIASGISSYLLVAYIASVLSRM